MSEIMADAGKYPMPLAETPLSCRPQGNLAGEVAKAEDSLLDFSPLDESSAQDQQFDWFLSLFPNRYTSYLKRAPHGEWRQLSRFHFLSDEEILESISGGAQFIRSVMPGEQSSLFAVIIEEASFYHDGSGAEKLYEILSRCGIKTFRRYFYQHERKALLLASFDCAVESTRLSYLISAWLRRNGIVPGTAGVEIFPGDISLCLPLQSGFTWLSDEGKPIACRDEISLGAALALFASDMTRSRINAMSFLEEIESLLHGER